MSIYIVTVKDANPDAYVEKAKKALKERKTGYAAIYGYRDAKGQQIFFDKPLIKYSQEEVNKFVSGLMNGKAHNDKIVYAIYRRHLDDASIDDYHIYKITYELPIYDDNENLIERKRHILTSGGLNAFDAAKGKLPNDAEILYVDKDNVRIKTFTSKYVGEEYSRGTIADLLKL